ncbi:glutamate receptor 3.2-like isoform X2 [Euphorbia lathyris]|uniref:glutamate receptor 3.2-like isoform X2 n=1 Tax=Euphorbia lathyris TaxID=212925 RepID=UPI00331440DB
MRIKSVKSVYPFYLIHSLKFCTRKLVDAGSLLNGEKGMGCVSAIGYTPLHGSHAPPLNLHTVSKDSNTLLNHTHGFEVNMVNSSSLDSSMKFANYMNKDSGFRKTKRRNNRLKIAVPMKSSFKQFVEVSDDEKRINGFSIDVFRAALRLLPNKFIYQMVPFNGSSDDLLKKVALKTFDAAVGDIMIKAEGFQFLEFSHPYVEAGLARVVKTRVDKSQPWLLFTLFTPGMWFSMAGMSLFTGFVVWFIEHQNNEELNESPARSISTVLWISLATLYLGHRETRNNSLSHFVLGPWLLLMLVVSATFTSSLTSLLTNSGAAPSLAMDVNELKRSNAIVGSNGNLFVDQYLVEVLGFKPRNIRSMSSSNEYAKALSAGDIKAAFILTPYAKVFLAEYCRGFAVAGPTYKLGGFGFVFQKGSALALGMSQAILRLSESGELQMMEERMLSSFTCSVSASHAKKTQSLGAEPFLGLFIISGCASAIALLIALFRQLKSESGPIGGRFWSSLFILFSLFQRKISTSR